MTLFGLPPPGEHAGAPQTPTRSSLTSIGFLSPGHPRLPGSNVSGPAPCPGPENLFSPQDSGQNRNPISNIFAPIGGIGNQNDMVSCKL